MVLERPSLFPLEDVLAVWPNLYRPLTTRTTESWG